MFIVASVILVKCVLLYKLYQVLPPKELKRRARGKDAKAAAIYKVAAYRGMFEIVVWILGTASAITIVLIAANASWVLAVIVMAFVAWLLVWAPRPRAGDWVWSGAAWLAPYHVGFLSFLQPVLGRVASMVPRFGLLHVHTGLYEKEDLLDLIDNQNNQLDNRIPEADLKIAFGGLTFGDKSVGSVMTPRRRLKLVAATDSIGPLLMDEVHASGFSRFPVVKDSTKLASPEIIGTLYLKDLIDHPDTGKVRDIMKKDVYFINESNNLREALGAFIKTGHHLLIVVNNFEELVGVLSLEDVIEQILGDKVTDEFERYGDLRAIAGLEARAEKANHKEVESPEQTEQTVVK